MKKLIALLLVVCLMPVCALGDAMHLSASWQADTAGVSSWLQALGIKQEDADAVGTAAAELMNLLTFSMTEDDANGRAQFALRLDGIDVLSADISTAAAEDSTACIYNFLPQCALLIPRSTVSETDVFMLLAGLMSIQTDLEQWFNGLPTTVESGNFTADAYACTKRIMAQITDADVADLLQTLLTRFSALMGSSQQAAELASALDAMKEKNKGLATLVIGMDDDDNVTGISVTLGQESNTLLTLSFGYEENEQDAQLRLVASFAIRGASYFADMTLSSDSTDQMVCDAVLLKADGRSTYRSAVAHGEKKAELHSVLTINQDLNIASSLKLADRGVIHDDMTLSYDDQGMFTLTDTATSGESKTLAFKFTLKTGQAEAMQPLDLSSIRTMTLEEALADESIINLLMSNASVIAMKLLPRLPMSLINLLFAQ